MQLLAPLPGATVATVPFPSRVRRPIAAVVQLACCSFPSRIRFPIAAVVQLVCCSCGGRCPWCSCRRACRCCRRHLFLWRVAIAVANAVAVCAGAAAVLSCRCLASSLRHNFLACSARAPIVWRSTRSMPGIPKCIFSHGRDKSFLQIVLWLKTTPTQTARSN